MQFGLKPHAASALRVEQPIEIASIDRQRLGPAADKPWRVELLRAMSRGKIVGASSSSLLILVASAALAFLAQIVTARLLGAEKFGVYASVLAWITTLGYVATLGFNVSLLRFVSAYRATQQWGLLRGVLKFSHNSTLVVAIILSVGVSAALTVFGSELALQTSQTTLLGLLAVPMIALHLVGAAAVRGFGSVAGSLWPERLLRDGTYLALMTCMIVAGVASDARVAMWAFLGGTVATLVAIRTLLASRWANMPDAPLLSDRAGWLRPVPALTLIMMVDNVMSRSGVMLLGVAGRHGDAGIFAAATAMSLLTALPRMAVGTAFAPSASALFARDDHAGLQALMAKSALLSLAGTMAVAVPLLVLAESLLAFFGPGFESGASVIRILVIGQMFAAACGPQQHILTMTGREWTGAVLYAASAIVNIACAVALMGPRGIEGVACAMTASLIAWNGAMAFFIWKQMKMYPGLYVATSSARSDWTKDCWAEEPTATNRAPEVETVRIATLENEICNRTGSAGCMPCNITETTLSKAAGDQAHRTRCPRRNRRKSAQSKRKK
ncbi:MAG: lipopolysaccharide biosynthesis protein [Hyphomicrobium sp.]